MQTKAGQQELAQINQDTIAHFITANLVETRTYDKYLTSDLKSKKFWTFNILDSRFFNTSKVVEEIGQGRSPSNDEMTRLRNSVEVTQVDRLPIDSGNFISSPGDLEKMQSFGDQPMTYILVRYKEAVIVAMLPNEVIVEHITSFCRRVGFKG
jgi:hypothetical protein